MNRGTVTSMVLGGIIAGHSVAALAQDSDEKMRNWQLASLFQPSEHQLEVERKGRVFIYDGLRTTDVERALEEQFDRIEHMMFAGTIIADEHGEAVIDPETGEAMVEHDGCD